MLKEGRMTVMAPMHHPTREELKVSNVTITAFDLAGHSQAQRLWHDIGPLHAD